MHVFTRQYARVASLVTLMVKEKHAPWKRSIVAINVVIDDDDMASPSPGPFPYAKERGRLGDSFYIMAAYLTYTLHNL